MLILAFRQNLMPIWTQDHVDLMRLFGKASYGCDWSELDYKDLEYKINAGTPKRMDGGDGYIRNIINAFNNSGEYIGDVALVTVRDSVELDIAIFNRFQGNGYTHEMIDYGISFAHQKGCIIVEATVRQTNQNFSKIEYLLLSHGFTKFFKYLTPDLCTNLHLYRHTS